MIKKYLLLLLLFSFVPSLFAQTPTTLRIAALRVEFQEDSNELTTGNGLFMIDTVTTEPFAIDPAPHDRTYFKDQIIAAANYFNWVSDGRLQIEGDVFPQGLNDAYKLPQKMGFYNPNTGDEDTDRGLATLVAHSVLAADEDPALDFSKYDLVVIFHAGVGGDINVGFDETPQDIPSLYISEEFLELNAPDSLQNIVLDGVPINKAIVLPETENQAGFEAALTGIFVSNIGSYLGLYDLFSAEEQRSGTGRFSLMDAGLFNLSGLIPAPPNAFHRLQLGWEAPLLPSADNMSVTLDRFNPAGASGRQVFKAPLNEDEHFLLEYRGDPDVYIDSLLFELSEGRQQVPSYMEVLKTYLPDRIEISDSSGVLLSVENYDWGLPGSGVLIWHIDEGVIRETGGRNINNDPEHRAVDLEEADGSQDIGEEYSILQAGFNSELGTIFDFWHRDNPTPLYKNTFSDSTIPNARSNRGRARSGINISNFSRDAGSQITFNYSRNFYLPGFPAQLSNWNGPAVWRSSFPGGLPGFLFALSANGEVHAVGANATSLLSDNQTLLAKVQPGGAGLPSMAFAAVDEDDRYEQLFVSGQDSLFSFYAGPAFYSEVFAVPAGGTVSSPLVVSGGTLWFTVDDTRLINMSFDGAVLSTEELSEPVHRFVPGLFASFSGIEQTYSAGFLTAAGPREIIYSAGSNTFSIYDGSSVSKLFQAKNSLIAPFTLTDFDQNGSYDIIYNTGEKIVARNQQGFLLDAFPFTPHLEIDEAFTGSPTVIKNNRDDLFVAISTNLGRLLLLNQNGEIVDGFPLAAGGNHSAGPVLITLSGDDTRVAPDWAVVSNSGRVSAWPATIDFIGAKVWGMPTADNYNYNPQVLESMDLGGGLLANKRFYNYPNPNTEDFTIIRYYLNDDAKVTLRLFDAAGDLVKTFSGPGQGDADNEVRLDLNDIASGIYLCQIEAKSAQTTERKRIKILVVH